MAKSNKSQNARSPYDWFQGQGAPEKKQIGWKAFLKILKIISYISLFVLSLAGCVQSMVIKTNNKTGAGLEFYNNVAEIAPYTTTFSLSNKYNEQVLGVDSQENYWLKDPEQLKNIHKLILDNGGSWGGTGKAWMSKNESIRFANGDVSTSTSSTDSNNTGIAYAGTQPFAISTTQSRYIQLYNASQKSFTILSPAQKKWSEAITGSIQDTSAWVPQEITFDPSELKTGTNLSSADLQFNFTYESFFLLLNYMQQNNIKLDQNNGGSAKADWGNTSKKDALSNNNKAFLDSYITTVAATNWCISEQKGTKISEQKQVSSTTLGWSAIAELRAIVDWGDSWHLGPFYGIFVYPLSKLTLLMTGTFPSMAGWSSVITIFLMVLLLRTFAYALTFKSTLQQVKQQEVQAKIAQINAKYEPYKGNKQMDQRKKQETMDVYKKENISPLGAIGSIFLTMPIFLSMWRVIGTIPHLKSTSVAGIVFASTSYQEVLSGHFQYLFIMVFSSSLQVVSILLPRWLSQRRDRRRSNIHQQAALKKQNKTQTIIAIVYAVFAAILPAGVSVYMIFSALYQIGQNALNHKILKWQSIRRKRAKGVAI